MATYGACEDWSCLTSLPSVSFSRFDFDFSLEESIQRRLDLSVKNSVSFMSRERELIGKVKSLFCHTL